jgi:hypothetical protein
MAMLSTSPKLRLNLRLTSIVSRALDLAFFLELAATAA